MLAEVEIRDFAIVRQARVELGAGLCVLSGETGAGKSLVIDAIAALLGERVGPDLIRAGADSARLTAVFDLADSPAAAALLAEMGLSPGADGLCLIARELQRGGRTRCAINGSTATVAMLRRLGETLIDLHGQHEHQSLLRVSEHLKLLDAAGGPGLAAVLARYQTAYHDWREVTETMAGLRLDDAEKARRVDSLRFQVDEIEVAGLRPGEVEELRGERSRLAHAERLAEAAARACRALAEAEDLPPAADRVADALAAVRDMAQYDGDLAPLADELETALAVIGEAARALAGYAEGLEADPRRLDAVEARLDRIERLCRKYGETVAEVLDFGERAAAELAGIERGGEHLAELERRRVALEATLAEAAAALRRERTRTAADLVTGVTGHLAELGMAGVRLVAELTPRPPDADAVAVDGQPCALGPDGADALELLFSANPGEPPRPLAKIASGGEVSRLMLALKSQLAASDRVPTMIFDEIDVGVGGITIHHVAAKMAALAAARQVICVTHHAPIAARADHHLAVDKSPDEAGPDVDIRRLAGEAQVHELARMLGRQPPTEATLALARELLDEVHA